MENQFNQNSAQAILNQEADAKKYVANVMLLMAFGLIISGAISYLFAVQPTLLSYLVNFETGKQTILGWVVMFAPLGMVLAMGGGFNRFSSSTLYALFIAFSVLMGASLWYIFLVYTLSSIYTVFFISSGMFGVMAFAGYTTKTDLTKFGSIMFMGLIGIIIASVVNWFMQSETMAYVISFIGVLVFTGLTAYDMQRIKMISQTIDTQSEEGKKMAVMGALNLYLDFINLFLMLLRLFGGRK